MSDEARQLWQEVFDLRAQRRSRSRRGPKLPFPSEPEMEQLARLLSLDESKIHHFSGSINGIIWDAHALHAFYGQRHKPTDVVEHVSDVLKAARNLQKELRALHGSNAAAQSACDLIDYGLVSAVPKGERLLASDYLRLLNIFVKAGTSAEREEKSYSKRGRRKGAGGNLAFDLMIEDLIMSARARGKAWTLSWNAYEKKFEGTILEAVTILRPYLPSSGFFPKGVLGRAIRHVRDKLSAHIKRGDDK
jgi:hypothetical protein